MALSSPGVEVTIIDQSQYLPSASNSVPLILLATSQNKSNAAGTGVAAATTMTNAGKLYQVTSQRDLVNLYGNPFFYKTTNGTPIHGYELNEYGLLAAYSLLGVTNRAYILRADIDLGALVGTLKRPVGNPADGIYWMDTTNSKWGIFEFNATTGKFNAVTPIVVVDSVNIAEDMPVDSIGNVGDYAIVPIQADANSFSSATYFYKGPAGTGWVELGSDAWKKLHPTVTSRAAPSASALLGNVGDTFTISLAGEFTVTIETTSNSVASIATSINNKNIRALKAAVVGGKLEIYYGDQGSERYLEITNLSGNVLETLDMPEGRYYSTEIQFAPSSEMPLWSASQAKPRPSGSVWVKTSVAGGGVDTVLSKYSSSTESYKSVIVNKYPAEFLAILDLDPTGGKSIPQGTVFEIVGNQSHLAHGAAFYIRSRTGQTIVTGAPSPNPQAGSLLRVVVTTPGTTPSSAISDEYVLTVSNSGNGYGTATTFVTDWLNTQIPNTNAIVTEDDSVQLIHTAGGDIYLSDMDSTGESNGIIAALGFTPGETVGTRKTAKVSYTNATATVVNVVSAGSAGVVSVSNDQSGSYIINSVVNGGSGYLVGDVIKVAGSSLGGGDDLTMSVQSIGFGGSLGNLAIVAGTPIPIFGVALSNWDELTYIANEGAPAALPLDGTPWYYSTATQVDIMVKYNGAWRGYKAAGMTFDDTGHPSAGSNTINPTGPILSATTPTLQVDGTPLVYGDLWLDTGDLENYPMIYRWEKVNAVDTWVLVDKTDQTSSQGILFADARWGANGGAGNDPISDPIPSITGMLTSDYVDLDAPDPLLFPQGMLLFNTRRSGYNVKEFRLDYFNGTNYPDALPAGSGIGHLPLVPYTWVSASGLNPQGAANMGRKAQRHMVVQALKAAIATNMTIREEDNFFNLIACPGYPELQPDMIGLNNERNQTAFIVGDTPLRLPDQATEIANWAKNEAGATQTGEDGWVTRDTYLGVYYPSGITSDTTGSQVVVPASHMMLRTFLRNDTIAYPWLAAAGTRRGTIDNATNIGYLDSATGEFVTIKNRMSLRDVMYTNQINPLAYFTGVGLLNYGNKTSYDSQSALDRVNVARLVAYIRERLQVAARPFVFEPNDALTRSQLAGVVQSLFIDLVAKRGLYDYLVVCDETNNTPARIDRNELWVDVAVEPVKAAEFIYIPVRIVNTGALTANG